MQTFLPYPSFIRSAECLDDKRLGKQRVEAKQIYLALTRIGYGWKNHPAVKMWKGYEQALLNYGFIVCCQWRLRGFNDTLKDFFGDKIKDIPMNPSWLTEELCRSHQSNLIRKSPEHYRYLWPDVPDDLPYIWPV
jgi:hypothetical protein